MNKSTGIALSIVVIVSVLGLLALPRWFDARAEALVRDVTGASPRRACVSGQGEGSRAMVAELGELSSAEFDRIREVMAGLPSAAVYCEGRPEEMRYSVPAWFLDGRDDSSDLWCSIYYGTGSGYLVRRLADGTVWLVLIQSLTNAPPWPSYEMSILMELSC